MKTVTDLNRAMKNNNNKTKWEAFHHDGDEYDLSHLDTFEWTVECQHKVDGPMVTYKFYVSFSHHAFTSSEKRSDSGIPYPTKFRESRFFDFQRYELSKQLPAIIQTLDTRICSLTNQDHNNYFTIEILDEEGVERDYEIYFAISRTERKGWMRLLVESAYVRDDDKIAERPKGRKIGFNVIARNTLEKRKINRRKK